MSTPESVRTLLVESIGGWRGIADSGLPVVVFVVANALGGLAIGIWAAVACAAVIFALRLARRDPVQQSISGLFAVGVAAFIAWRMGQARGFFLLGIWRNAIYGGVLLISVLVRWPLIGAAWEYLDGRGTAWRANRRLMRAYSAVTLVWVAVFAARVLVQRIFYVHNETGWLAGSSLAMGYPLMGAALLVTVLVVRRVTKDLPKPEEAATAEPDESPRQLAGGPGPE
jgi:hypothetical protein